MRPPASLPALAREASSLQLPRPSENEVLAGLPLWIDTFGMTEPDPRHYYADNRDRWVLHICLEGAGYVQTAGQKTRIEAPSLLSLAPGCFHEHWADREQPWTLFHWFLRRDAGATTQLLQELGLAQEVTPLSLGHGGADSPAQKLAACLGELLAIRPANRAEVYEQYLAMFRFHVLLSSCLPVPPGVAPHHNLIAAAEKVLLNFQNPGLNVNTLAVKLEVSRSTLTRVFREGGLTSPAKWIAEKRLTQAKNLLRLSPGIRLKQLAQACGYQDPAHFCRVYKRRYGVPPMQR